MRTRDLRSREALVSLGVMLGRPLMLFRTLRAWHVQHLASRNVCTEAYADINKAGMCALALGAGGGPVSAALQRRRWNMDAEPRRHAKWRPLHLSLQDTPLQ